jgi:hypothetical protein
LLYIDSQSITREKDHEIHLRHFQQKRILLALMLVPGLLLDGLVIQSAMPKRIHY